MCNRYNIKTNLREVAAELDANIAFDFDCSEEVFPGSMAPTLVINHDGHRELRPMHFGFGSGEGGSGQSGSKRGSRSALNNARVESMEKWTWKKSFQRFRCIVPITSFREPCYWGPQAGKELNFSATDGKLMLAAAIFSFNKSAPATAVCSMSLVMRPAIPFVMEHGHHRSPFFLRSDAVQRWMDRAPMSVDEIRRVLADGATDINTDKADQPSLRYDVARQMAASWNKRQPANLKKRDQQIADMDQTGVLGLGVDFAGDIPS